MTEKEVEKLSVGALVERDDQCWVLIDKFWIKTATLLSGSKPLKALFSLTDLDACKLVLTAVISRRQNA